MRALPSPSRRRFSKPALAIALIAAGIGSGAAGCAGRNIHPELREDSQVLVREWTMSTHGEFEAGDHGQEYSNPIVLENTLVFGNQSVGLISLYPGMMSTRWVLPIEGGVVSELLAHGGSIFFGGGDGFLYSVNAENGRVNWRYELRNPLVSRPTFSGGRLFVTTSDDAVYAFDAGTGKWLWHYRRRSSPASTILGASSPLVDGGEVLAGLSDGFMVALTLDDGQLKWERKLHQGTKFTDVDAHPVLEGGVVYVPSYDGALYALKRSSGEVIWRFDAGGSKQVVIQDQLIYLPSTDRTIYALNKSNAKVVWKFELDDGVPTNLILTDKHLIFGSSHQYFYVLDKTSGKGLYRYNVGYDSGFAGSPAYDASKQRVYALSGAGNLYAFSLRQPARKQRRLGQTDPYTF